MKKLIAPFSIIILCLFLTACSSNEVTHVGLNVQILELSSEMHVMIVKVLDSNSILGAKGEKCIISCESDELYYIYANNSTLETKDLQYEDFKVGDNITVDVTEDSNISHTPNSFAIAKRIQLLTQRLMDIFH